MNSMYDYYNYMNNLDNYNNANDFKDMNKISNFKNINNYKDMNNLNNYNNMNDIYNNLGLNNMVNNFKKDNLLDPYTGFIRGNMFDNLYDPYKYYQPDRISAKGEKDELLMQIQELAFAMNDIALYLDVKDDNNMVNTFNNYSKKKEELSKIYEEKYGPLVRDYYKYNNWKWDNNPWPWEVVR